MYIKDAIELLHAGFTMEDIKAMDREAKTAETETPVEKTPEPVPEQADDQTTPAQKTVDEAQEGQADLIKRIDELETELKKAQALNAQKGVEADIPEKQTATSILNSFISDNSF